MIIILGIEYRYRRKTRSAAELFPSLAVLDTSESFEKNFRKKNHLVFAFGTFFVQSQIIQNYLKI